MTPDDQLVLEDIFSYCIEEWLRKDHFSVSNLQALLTREISKAAGRGYMQDLFVGGGPGHYYGYGGMVDYGARNLTVSVDVLDDRDLFRGGRERKRVSARICADNIHPEHRRGVVLGYMYEPRAFEYRQEFKYAQIPPETRPLPSCPKCRERELPTASASWCERCSSMMWVMGPQGPGTILARNIAAPIREEQDRIREAIGYLRYLMTLGAACLWDQVDDATKRFVLVREERERAPIVVTEEPVADERFGLLELSDVPEPTTPPKPYVPYVRPPERASEIDRWGGVGELLLELV